jgi:hypothetical protein
MSVSILVVDDEQSRFLFMMVTAYGDEAKEPCQRTRCFRIHHQAGYVVD